MTDLNATTEYVLQPVGNVTTLTTVEIRVTNSIVQQRQQHLLRVTDLNATTEYVLQPVGYVITMTIAVITVTKNRTVVPKCFHPHIYDTFLFFQVDIEVKLLIRFSFSRTLYMGRMGRRGMLSYVWIRYKNKHTS